MNSMSHQMRGLLLSALGFVLLVASLSALFLSDSLAVSVVGMAIGAVCVFAGYLWTMSHKAGPLDRPD